MKKFIISVFAFLAIATTVSTTALADVPKFNTDPSDLPTVMVNNVTQSGGCASGPGAGCWTTAINANPGDTIAVQVYLHNSTPYLAENTTVGLKPQSTGTVSNVTFTGVVASTSIDRSYGSATVTFSSPASLSFIPGSLRLYKHGQTTGYGYSNEADIFGTNGLLIGEVSPGWDTQAVVVANFKVSGSVTPQTYQCSDNIDNDGDGLIDYPADPGCTGPTDNDEYNQSQQQYCTLDLSTDRTSINAGEPATLSWTSSNCTNLQLSGFGAVGSSGSRTVYPTVSTSYTLTGQSYNGQTTQDSVSISVGQQQQTCSINSFFADATQINRGSTTYLRWNTTGVNYVTLTPNYGGQLPANGSISISPFESTTYTLNASCTNDGILTRTINVTVINPQGPTGSVPQAITTVAAPLGTSARLNGIAIPNTTAPTYAWFEWGNYAALGSSTARQTVVPNTSTAISDVIQGLIPGGTYYYRIVVQNPYGTAQGSIVRFTLPGGVPPTTTTVVKYVPQPASTTIVAKSAPSLLELKVESMYDHMCVGGQIQYTISYRNLSSTLTLQNAVLRVALPKEMDYVGGTMGSYDVVDKTITVPLGNLLPAAEGSLQFTAHVNQTAMPGTLAVTTATVVYTNSATHAQEDAIAYSLVTVTNDCPALLGASVFGLSFLPHTLLGWLLLILVILALIVVARQLTKKNPPAPTV